MDGGLILIAVALFGIAFHLVGGQIALNVKTAPIFLGVIGGLVLFYKFLWCLAGGDTPGMNWTRLKLVDFDGQKPQSSQRLYRLASEWLSLLAAGLGLIWALVDEESLTWHDHISRTFPLLIDRPTVRRVRRPPTWTLGPGHSRVRAKGEDLIPSELRLRSSHVITIVRPVVSTSTARFQASVLTAQQLLQHLDHIFIRMIVVVEQDYVVEGNLLVLVTSLLRLASASAPPLIPQCYHYIEKGGATDSTGLNRCGKACRVPSSRKTIGKQQLPIQQFAYAA